MIPILPSDGSATAGRISKARLVPSGCDFTQRAQFASILSLKEQNISEEQEGHINPLY